MFTLLDLFFFANDLFDNDVYQPLLSHLMNNA